MQEKLGNKRLRTRRDLLYAAARLMQKGAVPSMDEIAQEALVSRATAYRYFTDVDELLVEVPIEESVPSPESLFDDDDSLNVESRVDRAEAAMHESVYRNVPQLRRLLARRIANRPAPGKNDRIPAHQNRRAKYIEVALAPARVSFEPEIYRKLCASLALIFGPESMIVFEDVIGIDEKQARKIKSWAVRALVRAALAETKAPQRGQSKTRGRQSPQ